MWAVAELSLRKMREGSLYILIAIGMVICVLADFASPVAEQLGDGSLFSYALGSQSLQTPPITAGTSCAMLFCVLLGVFWGTSEIPGDIASGLAMVVLSKPIGRFRYVFGKYLAMLLATLLAFALFESLLLISHFVFGTGSSAYTLAAILRQLLPPLMLIPLVAIAMTFSLVAGAMGAMIFTIVYLLFSLVMSFLPVTLSLFPAGTFPGVNMAAAVSRFFFPNLLYYFQDSVSGWFLVLTLLVYTVALTVLFLLLMAWRVRSMDLNSGGA